MYDIPSTLIYIIFQAKFNNFLNKYRIKNKYQINRIHNTLTTNYYKIGLKFEPSKTTIKYQVKV